MTRLEFIDQIAYLKECQGVAGTQFEHLGRSVHDKIANIAKNPKNVITHFHVPKGNPESVEKLKSQHQSIFGVEMNPEMVSFFTCFDGFEFRYVNLDQAWKTFMDEEVFDWEAEGFDAAKVQFSDLQKQEFELPLDDFNGHFWAFDIFDDNVEMQRLSNPSKSGITFYEDSVDIEDNAIKSFVPPAEFFLSDGNKVYGQDKLFYLNFHHSFRQLGYGSYQGKISLFNIDDAAADIADLREDFRIHFKKQLIRTE